MTHLLSSGQAIPHSKEKPKTSHDDVFAARNAQSRAKLQATKAQTKAKAGEDDWLGNNRPIADAIALENFKQPQLPGLGEAPRLWASPLSALKIGKGTTLDNAMGSNEDNPMALVDLIQVTVQVEWPPSCWTGHSNGLDFRAKVPHPPVQPLRKKPDSSVLLGLVFFL